MLKTPQEWAKEIGVVIMDDDGWRLPGSPSFYEPTTREDFEYRLQFCTVSVSNQ